MAGEVDIRKWIEIGNLGGYNDFWEFTLRIWLFAVVAIFFQIS